MSSKYDDMCQQNLSVSWYENDDSWMQHVDRRECHISSWWCQHIARHCEKMNEVTYGCNHLTQIKWMVLILLPNKLAICIKKWDNLVLKDLISIIHFIIEKTPHVTQNRWQVSNGFNCLVDKSDQQLVGGIEVADLE